MFDQPNRPDPWNGDGDEYGDHPLNCLMRAAILDGHTVVPCRNVIKWGTWFQTADRHVAETFMGRAWVSTVFLGLDHSHGRGRPLWFETMVFHNGDPGDMDRYTTWEEAEAGHARIVARERASFRAWIANDGDTALVRVKVIGWEHGIAELDDGTLLPTPIVYRNRRRVPLRADTYKRRFQPPMAAGSSTRP
jgi:hypothetical protein